VRGCHEDGHQKRQDVQVKGQRGFAGRHGSRYGAELRAHCTRFLPRRRTAILDGRKKAAGGQPVLGRVGGWRDRRANRRAARGQQTGTPAGTFAELLRKLHQTIAKITLVSRGAGTSTPGGGHAWNW